MESLIDLGVLNRAGLIAGLVVMQFRDGRDLIGDDVLLVRAEGLLDAHQRIPN